MELIDGQSYMPQVTKMIQDSAANLNQDTAFHHFEAELKDVETKYLPPNGNLIVAVDEGEFQGMVAYTRVSKERCEMKRLYVRREARGQHLGDQLVTEILEKAKNEGYIEIILKAPTNLIPVINLYKKHGFEEYSGEDVTPQANSIYLIRDL